MLYVQFFKKKDDNRIWLNASLYKALVINSIIFVFILLLKYGIKSDVVLQNYKISKHCRNGLRKLLPSKLL